MANNQAVRLTARFVDYHQVSKIVCIANLDQVFEHVATAVDPGRIRHHQFKFLLKAN